AARSPLPTRGRSPRSYEPGSFCESSFSPLSFRFGARLVVLPERGRLVLRTGRYKGGYGVTCGQKGAVPRTFLRTCTPARVAGHVVPLSVTPLLRGRLRPLLRTRRARARQEEAMISSEIVIRV